MSTNDVTMTGAKAVPARSSSNRRASVRYQCGPATPGQVQVEGQEWQRAWVLDLSVSGVGLLVSRELQAGLEIVIHLKSPAAQQTYALPARIRHASRQLDGEWILGCEFAGKLTDEQLDALLL
jgi:hypothetical protein